MYHPNAYCEIKRPDESYSYQDYRLDLLSQLQEIDADSDERLTEIGATGLYRPLYPVGGSRSNVLFVSDFVYMPLINLMRYAEDHVITKGACTTEFAYSLFDVKATVKIKDDEVDGVLTDGIGYASKDIFL